MKYELNLEFSSLTCKKPTGEDSDEIYMFGFGINQKGEMNFISPRRIESKNVKSFRQGNSVYADTLDWDNPIITSIDLPNKTQLGYMVILWIAESDNTPALESRWNEITELFDAWLQPEIDKLSKMKFPKEYIYFQAVANVQLTLHAAINAGLKTNQSSFDVFFPIVEYFHPNGYNNANPASVNYEPLSTVIGFENDGFYMNFKRNNIGEYDGPRYVFYFIWRFTVSGVETTTENH